MGSNNLYCIRKERKMRFTNSLMLGAMVAYQASAQDISVVLDIFDHAEMLKTSTFWKAYL